MGISAWSLPPPVVPHRDRRVVRELLVPVDLAHAGAATEKGMIWYLRSAFL